MEGLSRAGEGHARRGLELMEIAAEEAGQWSRAAKAADEEGQAIGGKEVVLRYEATMASRDDRLRRLRVPTIKFAHFRTALHEIRSQQAANLEDALYSELIPALTVTAPKGGYLVSKAYAAWMSEKLKLHGIRYQVLPAAMLA